ncbi:energy-coupling factor transporter transmembrane protein EcfT [Streptomyces parvulus]|uniref:energy-coupling factor transporter transmembrane protein EcfT n=1 Tax=Streptomyces parvulus TaxID=146923 RepID=UPI001CFB0A77|nr:energy-coupling factor transporter transmembrane protein EcfT [Streptomyces parvulus]
MSFAAKDPCDALKGTPGYEYCARDNDGAGPPDGGPASGGDGLTGGAVTNLQDLADSLIKKIQGLVAPDSTWAPEKADSWLYSQFLWLGQHLAVAIFICVVVVCALTAWQGAPRMRQLGASTGWTLAAVAGMASVPGAVMLLNKAVSNAFTVAFNSDEGTLFGVIREDMKDAGDAENPLSIMIIFAALVVALGFAALVFMTRSLGILVFVCLAPVVLASLARGGDTSALKAWMMRLLGLMFAPFALLLISPFVQFTEGAIVMDAVLLVAADVLMLRMIFHGVPYFGPRLAGAARTAVERRTESPLARAVVRAGAPDVYEQESTPRYPRTVDTPGRAMSQDRGVLFGAYGLNKQDRRPGRLTTESASAKAARDTARTTQISAARAAARTAARPVSPGGPAQQPQPAANRAVPSQAPAPQPAPTPPTNP